MMFAKAIGVTDLTPRWSLPVSQSDLDYSAAFIDKSKKNVLIAPCSSKQEKDWGAEHNAEIAKWLAAQNINVLIAGSPSAYETETAAKIQQLTPNCINIAGKTSLKQLAALIKQVDLVISPDTGAAHIATTQGTPVIGLYAIHNPRRTAPYNDRHNVVSVYDQAVLDYYGKPWYELPWATKAKSKSGEKLMERISVDDVKKKIVETLAVKL
ncbi:ADP-heptose:LPS heptosyltransferase [Actinobacillus pleuropneumoniae]|nr:ADP-heptose:LPS heptosyltransferase [Actinobacillus pleuropneumoniae]